MTVKPTSEELEERSKEVNLSGTTPEPSEKAVGRDPDGIQGDSCERSIIHVSGIDIAWNTRRGTCTFENLPVAMMWVDTTLAGLMAGVQAMVGTERFALALQSEGRKSVEADWRMISEFPDFREGFKAIANIAGVAGWGEWVIESLDGEQKECRFLVRDSWEGRYQRALGVCWGSAMLAGKLAGYCSRLFGTNCWADQTAFIAKGEICDEFLVRPSPRSIEKEIEGLLACDEATRADMAVALQRLEREISERRRAEETLKERDLFLKETQKIARLGGWKANPHTDFLEWTDGVYEIVEARRDYRPGLSEGLTFFLPEYVPAIRENVAKCLATGELFSMECRVTTATGKKLWTEVRGLAPVVEGERSYVMGTFQDITERKLSVKALEESEERYRNLVENTNEAIMVIEDGTVKFVNSRAVASFGYTEQELRSTPVFELIHPEDRDMVIKRYREKIDGDAMPTRHTCRVTHKSGGIQWIEISSVLIDWEGRPATLNLISDITERKRAEEEREKLQAQLLQAQKMESVGRLAGGVAHDFNNMLQAILGQAEMVSMTLEQDHPVQRHLKQIQEAAERSAAVVRQLLAFARKQAVSPRSLDLNDTVSAMLKMVRRLIGEDIDLAWMPGNQLWKVLIDPSQVDQILVNLVVNARDAISGVGRITIETRNMLLDESYCHEHPECIPGEYALLAVTDNGTGMSEEVLDQLFEPFFTTKEPGKGTGLGLSTIYGIVKQNNGCIEVQSHPGKGATFKVYLPAFETEAAKNIEGSLSQTLQGGAETILLVEDEEMIRDATHALLERLGYNVLSAKTPSHAIRLTEENVGEIELLISDVVMPEMNGRDLAERMTALRPGMKTLFMSGYTADVIAHQGVLENGVNFIQKPFSLIALAAKVREVLDRG